MMFFKVIGQKSINLDHEKFSFRFCILAKKFVLEMTGSWYVTRRYFLTKTEATCMKQIYLTIECLTRGFNGTSDFLDTNACITIKYLDLFLLH